MSIANQRMFYTDGDVKNPTVRNIQKILTLAKLHFSEDLANIVYVKSENQNEPSGHHFNLPGHNVSDIEGLVIEPVKSNDPFILKAREQHLIQRFDTFRNGLNKEN